MRSMVFFCSENKKAFKLTILRDEWGFEGFVVTDWGAKKGAAAGVKAGLNLVMPGGYGTHEQMLKESLKNHELTEEQLNTAVADILQFILDAYRNKLPNAEIDREKCSELSGELAAQCAVLLKNEDILPLKKDTKIAVIGDFCKESAVSGKWQQPHKCFKNYLRNRNVKRKRGLFSLCKRI